jgi:hypothetical protein
MYRSSLLAAFVAFTVPAHSATIVNGSFEDGIFAPVAQDTQTLNAGDMTITGWTIISDEVAWIGPGNPFGVSASDGQKFLDLTDFQDAPPFGGVSQTISTVAGEDYILSFDLGSSAAAGLISEINVTAGSAMGTFSTSNVSSNNFWETIDFAFTATGASTDLSFVGNDGDRFIGLDNISIRTAASAVPLPTGGLLLLSGLLA